MWFNYVSAVRAVMSSSPNKWDTFRKNVQLVVGTLLAITAAAYVEALGLLGLGLIWLGLYAVVSTVYAVRFRIELREARKAVTRPTKTGERGSLEVQRLESDLAKTQAIAEQLMVDRSELRKQIRELENPQRSFNLDAVEGLRKQFRSITDLRTYNVPLEGNQRKYFLLWHKRTIMLLEQAFGKGSDEVEEFLEVDFFPDRMFAVMFDEYTRKLDEAEVILKVALERLELS